MSELTNLGQIFPQKRKKAYQLVTLDYSVVLRALQQNGLEGLIAGSSYPPLDHRFGDIAHRCFLLAQQPQHLVIVSGTLVVEIEEATTVIQLAADVEGGVVR